MKLVEKLNRLIREKGCTQRHVARYLGDDSPGTVNRWFTGAGIPGLKASLGLARLFGVPLEYLADDDMDDPPGAMASVPAKAASLTVEEEILLATFRARSRAEGISGLSAVGAIMGIPAASEVAEKEAQA